MNMALKGTEENYLRIFVSDEVKGFLFIIVLCGC